MCRFLLYAGEPIHLSSLITEPEHSLIRQSFHSREREEPLNGDGFGIAWYAPEVHSDAVLFRSITPAWSNQNLRHLSKAIRSRCVLAHVRAASSGLSVSESNTHPFVCGPYAFMHNGLLADYWRHRRDLLGLLDERHYEMVRGTTDTECLFVHVLQDLAKSGFVTARKMATSLEKSIGKILAVLAEKGVNAPSYINAVLSDGREAVACRYTNADDQQAPSLHLHTGRLYTCRSGKPELVEAHEDEHSVIISSEPLTGDASWQTLPNNSIVTIDSTRSVSIRPIEVGLP
ncbi:MAG: class II glutamine amidotransferase [Planctomycetes bacterium]|nr:class II glutamine amidotransferase [Planctomycetota bacterium]